jgi:predicted DNA-binding mobile mystery protein A
MSPDLRPLLIKGLDASVEAMQAARRAVNRPNRGWLGAVREAVGLSIAKAASKVGISRQAYSEAEEREASFTITLDSLRRAADALDCELVYFLLPKAEAAGNFAALAARNGPSARNLKAAEHSMLLEGQEAKEKTDGKNVGLAKQIYWLRQNLELYELVTVNAGKIKEVGASEALFAHIQRLAMEAIAVSLCKIYEREGRNELNSINGVINALPGQGPYTDVQRKAAERFAARHGIRRTCSNPREFLTEVFDRFIESHAAGFLSLKTFRDKFVGHSEHNFELGTLPSFDEFESLYGFAYDLYQLISDSFLDVGPALMNLYVRNGFVKLLRSLGIANPAAGFPALPNAR